MTSRILCLKSQYKSKEYVVNNSKGAIVIIDTGTKFSIIRNVLRTGYNAVVVPWDTSFEEIQAYKPKGVVISNGPGDPKMCQATIKTAKSHSGVYTDFGNLFRKPDSCFEQVLIHTN